MIFSIQLQPYQHQKQCGGIVPGFSHLLGGWGCPAVFDFWHEAPICHKPPCWVQGGAAQLHKTDFYLFIFLLLNVPVEASTGNATGGASNLPLLNYAPLWQIVCRLHARWREFSVSASGLVNITISSQGYLLIPDGARCALCISPPICGAYFFPRNESALIFYTFFLFLCQYVRVSRQNKQRVICIYTRFAWNKELKNKKKKGRKFYPTMFF